MTRAVPAEQNRKPTPVAIYHLSVKPIQRSKGRTATAAAAYRAGCKIVDERTGEIHDYRRRGGVVSSEVFAPKDAPAWASDRAKLWNAAEVAEKRKDGTPAREYEVALPAELTEDERRMLVAMFCHEMATEEGCAVDAAIHAPGKEGDNRNHHAHILRTTRRLGPDGFGAKLDTEQADRKRRDDLEAVRARWAEHCNRALEMAGHAARVDHRSNAERGLGAVPTLHDGPVITAMERRRPGQSWIKREREDACAAIQQAAQEAAQAEVATLESWPELAELEAALAEAQYERGREDKRDQEEQERQRWKAMSAAELAAEIKRLRPPPVASLIKRDDGVRQAAAQLEGLSTRSDQAARIERQAREQADEWREQHPRHAWLHEKGIGHAPFLREREEQQAQARQELEELSPHLEAAQQAHRDAQGYARERIHFEQAPVLLKVAELEKLQQSRLQSELEQERQRAPGCEHYNDRRGPSLG